jgi:hypothetical protein
VHKIDSLGFYNLGRDQLAKQLGLSGPKTTALIQHAKIKEDGECFRRITIGKAVFDRYSQKAIGRLNEATKVEDMNKVWAEYQYNLRRRTRP